MNPLSDPLLRTSFSALVGVSAHTPTLTVRDGIAYGQTHFLRQALPELAAAGPIVLVTHASDATADDALSALIPPNVKAWFSVNSATAKARPLPIGLRSDSVNCELLAVLRETAAMPKWGGPMVYLCATWDNPHLPESVRVERRNLYQRFGSEPWATCRGGKGIGDVPFAEYCADLRAHRFALCPRGAGFDSHRIAEAWYLGCIPIIRRCAWSERFTTHSSPWLAVHSWSQVTPKLLDREYVRLINLLEARREMLTASYWTKAIIGEA